MKLVALATAALLIAMPMTAAAAAEPEAPITLFFGKLKAGPSAEAFKAIWTGTLMEKKAGEMQVAADQMDTAIRYFGPVLDWEPIGVGSTSPHFQERYYLLRTRGGPLFFKFTLYENGERWTISKFTFHDDFDKFAVPQVIRKEAP